jgi:hypothetical protein
MAKCPVCNTEYNQSQDKTCSNPKCGFPISWYSQSSFPRDTLIRESLKNWAKNVFGERSHLPKELESDKEPISISKVNTSQSQVRGEQEEIIRRLEQLEAQLKQDREERSRFQYQLNQTNEELEQIKSQLAQLTAAKQAESFKDKKYISWKILNLINQYNCQSDTILNKVIEVYETEESYHSRSSKNSQSVVLEKSNRGSYWLITEEDCNYLFPKYNLKITEFNYQTLQALFESQGYQPGESQRFQLLKPAQVCALPGEEKWQLIERGVLLFLKKE